MTRVKKDPKSKLSKNSKSSKVSKMPLKLQTVQAESHKLALRSFRCWRSDNYVIQLLRERGWRWRGEITNITGKNYLSKFRTMKKENKIENSKCLWWTDDNEPSVLNGYSASHVIGGFPGMEQALTKVSHRDLFNGQPWFPICFQLPLEKEALQETMEKLKKDSFWIMKPPDAYGGAGIRLYKSGSAELNNIIQNPPRKCFIVQRYMENPILFGGYKFHIRAYCCITSLEPFRGYLHREGQAEFSTHVFDLEQVGDKFNKYSHITNMKVNTEKKNLPFYRKKKDVVGCGTEWSLRMLIDYLEKNHGDKFDVDVFWQDMHKISKHVLETLTKHKSVVRHAKNSCEGGNFQLFGLDFLMDENCKLFLTECNTRPGMDYTHEALPDGTVLENVKEGNRVTREVLNDTITLLGIDDYGKNSDKLPFIKLF